MTKPATAYGASYYAHKADSLGRIYAQIGPFDSRAEAEAAAKAFWSEPDRRVRFTTMRGAGFDMRFDTLEPTA
jgi:streptogramin lyase